MYSNILCFHHFRTQFLSPLQVEDEVDAVNKKEFEKLEDKVGGSDSSNNPFT